MAIAANQLIDTGYDFTVNQVAVDHPLTKKKSGFFMNIREDDNQILGWTTERYGLVQHRDVVAPAVEQARAAPADKPRPTAR